MHGPMNIKKIIHFLFISRDRLFPVHESASDSRDAGLLLGCLAFKVKALRNVVNCLPVDMKGRIKILV